MSQAVATSPLDPGLKSGTGAAPTRELEDQVDEMLMKTAHGADLLGTESSDFVAVNAEQLRESVNKTLAGSPDAAKRAVAELDRALSGTAEKILEDGFDERMSNSPVARLVERPREVPPRSLTRHEEVAPLVESPLGAPTPLVVDAPSQEAARSRVAASSGRTAASALLMVGSVFALPLRGLPHAARDLVGWFALVTLFNAACVWLYVLVR